MYAGMVELADTQDLGSCASQRAGSTPVTRTKPEKSEPNFPDRKRVRIFCLYMNTYKGSVIFERSLLIKIVKQ